MLRTTIEINGLKKAEFNILENDYDTGTTNNYDSKSASSVGSLSEPKEELSAESVILFDGTTENSSSEPIAQISNVIFGDVVYDETQLELDLSDGMYHGAECGEQDKSSGAYASSVNVPSIKWDGTEVIHLTGSELQYEALLKLENRFQSGDYYKAYRYMNRVESKVVNKSITVIVDGYKL